MKKLNFSYISQIQWKDLGKQVGKFLQKWITLPFRTMFEIVEEFPYLTFFILLFIGFFPQTIFAGSDIGFSFPVACVACLLLWFVPSKLKKTAVPVLGLITAIIMSLFYSQGPGGCDCEGGHYTFSNGQPFHRMTFWNPLFKNFNPNIETRDEELNFTLVMKEGDFEIRHFCEAHVDMSTWLKFGTDEEKLKAFIYKDAHQRLVSSFSECRLDQTKNLKKVYYYTNGQFAKAKIVEMRTNDEE